MLLRSDLGVNRRPTRVGRGLKAGWKASALTGLSGRPTRVGRGLKVTSLTVQLTGFGKSPHASGAWIEGHRYGRRRGRRRRRPTRVGRGLKDRRRSLHDHCHHVAPREWGVD
jgi:hypothetical protein